MICFLRSIDIVEQPVLVGSHPISLHSDKNTKYLYLLKSSMNLDAQLGNSLLVYAKLHTRIYFTVYPNRSKRRVVDGQLVSYTRLPWDMIKY